MFRKALNNRRSRPEVFCKNSALKILKKSQENTCIRVSFLVKFQVKDCNFIKKRLQHMYFPVKYANFFLQNTSGRTNKKRSKVHKQGILLKIIYYRTTGYYLTKHSMFLFEVKQRTPRVLLMPKTLLLSLWRQKL